MILVRHGQSHFNVHFSVTREDPGIVDPGLTDEGERQAKAAADGLLGQGIRRIVASPYWRTLHTAEIIAESLGLTVTIEPQVRERYFFTCDIGSHRSDLVERWPGFGFGDLPERWWPDQEETEDALAVRCAGFRRRVKDDENWEDLLIVSHWGFIRGLTGEAVANGVALRFNPHADAVSPAF